MSADSFASGDAGTVGDSSARGLELNVAAVAADITTETLLRCWLRESGVPVPAGTETVRVRLVASGLSVRARLTHRSPSGWHRFDQPELVGASGAPAAPVDAGVLAALIIQEITATHDPPTTGITALQRIADSTARIAGHLQARRSAPSVPTATASSPLAQVPQAQVPQAPFLTAEQASLTGHPFHPAAQSRHGASDETMARYSPERGGSFPLHWFAAHPRALASSSTLPHPDLRRLLTSLYDDGRQQGSAPVPATSTQASRTTALPSGFVPIPAHPWQARELLADPDGPVGALLATGQLVDLGVTGAPWHATTSVRTVWRPDRPVMLKLSLGLRITNSRRVLLRDELRLGEMIARLVDAGLGTALAARHPTFRLIGEPNWVAVDAPGLETALRTNPFGASDRVVCASSLVAVRPDRAVDSRGRARAAMLPAILVALGQRHHEPPGLLAETWFDRYLAVLVTPVLELYLHHGVGVEAHLQNTLVSLDDDGWPVAGWYRDSQGYYIGESAVDATQRLLPGFAAGLDVVFPDPLVIDRIIYYLFVNNVFAIAGALGAAGVADEHRLLGRVRTLLARLDHTAHPGQSGPRPPEVRRRLLSLLRSATTLPSKGNLRTLIDGRDELIGPVATQSIYVQIPNPLLEGAP
ncbi:IucA/IucC family siderophore biosynthesis protein [Frankia sp. R82]|uniref:IucA/IucC family protein n=1 Tax=Frankia sp. R82 TaxID=2950553 RepID=UPI002043785E|nr:IucA/IucC family protein [Frankia sp. R82]MCM3885599.1 siderophore synthetase [Frankia sp. R82]